MKYTAEMMLTSESGYSMPFAFLDGDEVTSNFGESTNPNTGEKVVNRGIDFNAAHHYLKGLATGVVSTVSEDPKLGIFMKVRYGKYEVMYSHLAAVYANFSSPVVAGQNVALSAEMVHLEVSFDGEIMNPMDFLMMLYGYTQAQNPDSDFSFTTKEMESVPFVTDYDKYQDQITSMALRYLPEYLFDIFKGKYKVPSQTEQSLRNSMSVASEKGYFYKTMPTVFNPLGLDRSQSILALGRKIMNEVIGDFLRYMELLHGITLQQDMAMLKKNLTKKPTPSAVAPS